MSVVKNKKRTLLGFELTSHQDAIVNYLVPSICACLLYVFLIASDSGLIYSHYKNDDPVWASVSLFFVYLPVIGSYVIVVSNWELWPEYEGCGRENLVWFVMKTLEHIFFPVWSMWRFAERIFWSVEAVRANDEKSIEKAKTYIDAPRSIELYVFLQSYLHSLPQILTQLFILMRHNTDINKQTAEAQTISLVFNLAKISITTTYFQRFKAQKLAGKQYPWFKSYKVENRSNVASPVAVSDNEVTLRKNLPFWNVVQRERSTLKLDDKYNVEKSRLTDRRRSSDIYLEPSTSQEGGSNRRTVLETDFDETVKTRVKTDSVNATTLRETPFTGILFNGQGFSEPDFNISRVIDIEGLQEDDLAGKSIAFLWWFSFLLARVLAVSAFSYFFIKETVWLLSCHYLLAMLILLYDVKSDAVRRAKALFFVFICFVYLFCIIEFKIRFKKATLIY